MSILSVRLPGLIHYFAHARNGLYPDATFYAETTGALNHATAYCRKPIYRRVCKLTEAGGTSGVAWRWHCRTGYGARRFAVVCLLGLDDRVLAVDPYIAVSMTKSGGSPVTVNFHGGTSAIAATDAPDEWIQSTQYIAADGNSVYTGQVEFFDNVRVVALMVYEDSVPTVDEVTPYHSEWEPAAGSPIYDNRIGRQLEAVGNMHRKNGALRFDWGLVTGAARTRTSATPICLVDNAAASPPTAADPSVVFNTNYRNTYSATTVPITMAVYGSIPAGSGTVVFRDTSGNDAATVTINNATPQWFTATGALTVGATQRYSPYFYSDGVNLLSVKAVSVYEEG